MYGDLELSEQGAWKLLNSQRCQWPWFWNPAISSCKCVGSQCFAPDKPRTGYKGMVYTLLEARAIIIKTVRWQTAQRLNEKGVGVKVVSGQLQRLTDRIISNRDGKKKGGDDIIKPEAIQTHICKCPCLKPSHYPTSITQGGPGGLWVSAGPRWFPSIAATQAWFVTTNSTHGNCERGWGVGVTTPTQPPHNRPPKLSVCNNRWW